MSRILFVTSTRLGDAVLSTGILQTLLTDHPGARFTVACGPVAAGVFARMPRLERLIVVEKRRADLHWPALWAGLVGLRWDLAVDLRGSALTWLLRARRRAGPRVAHLAGVLGLDPPPLPVAWIDAADRARAAALLPAGASILALGPTANWAGKIWPAERFVALARALPFGRVAVFGGPGAAERAAAAPVIAALGAIDLVGVGSVAEAAACLARCALYIGNDSGLMHLAAAAGVPTVGLFGPTSAVEYGPAGPRAAAAVAPAPSMAALDVEAALAVARRVMAASA